MTAPIRRRSTVNGPPEIVEAVGPPWRTALLLGAVVMLLAAATVAAFDQFDRGRGIDLPRLELPDVAGGDAAAARQRLEALGFVVEVLYQPNESPDLPKGTVFSQRPPAGAKVPQGDVVTVLVSDGPLGLQVPDVGGQQEIDGVVFLQRAGMATNVVPTFDEAIRPGQILGTDPPAGQRTAPGSVVTVLVSNGPAPKTVPDVVNLTAAEALLQIGRAGLAPGAVTREVRSDVPAGAVLSTDPAAGTQVPKATPVKLTVAIAEPRARVPFLVGLLQTTATAVLSDAGLQSSLVASPVPAGDPSAGRVLSQGTPPRAEVDPGTVVQITVAVAEPTPTTAPPPGVAPSTTAPGG